MNKETEQGNKGEEKAAAVSSTRFFVVAGLALAAVFGLTFWSLSGSGASMGALPGQPASVSAPYFLALFAIATVVLLLLIRFMSRLAVAVALMRFSLVAGVSLVGWRFFGDAGAVLAVPLAVLLTTRKAPVWAVNTAVVLASAGVAVQVGGAMSPISAAITIAALAVYDLVAVFGTKHMVYMAKKLSQSGAVFALTVPATTDGWFVGFDQVKPKQGFGFLGIGDLVIPTLLLAATANNYPHSAAVAAGSMGGLAMLAFWLLPKSKGFMPALPPLVLGATVGFGVASLFF